MNITNRIGFVILLICILAIQDRPLAYSSKHPIAGSELTIEKAHYKLFELDSAMVRIIRTYAKTIQHKDPKTNFLLYTSKDTLDTKCLIQPITLDTGNFHLNAGVAKVEEMIILLPWTTVEKLKLKSSSPVTYIPLNVSPVLAYPIHCDFGYRYKTTFQYDNKEWSFALIVNRELKKRELKENGWERPRTHTAFSMQSED